MPLFTSGGLLKILAAAPLAGITGKSADILADEMSQTPVDFPVVKK